MFGGTEIMEEERGGGEKVGGKAPEKPAKTEKSSKRSEKPVFFGTILEID